MLCDMTDTPRACSLQPFVRWRESCLAEGGLLRLRLSVASRRVLDIELFGPLIDEAFALVACHDEDQHCALQ